MAGPAKIKGHPIHPMVVPFPIALWIFSLAADLVYAFGWGDGTWTDVAFYAMAGGVVGAIAAAVPGAVDFASVTSPPVRRIARWHMSINLTLVALYVVNLWLRAEGTPGAALPVVFSFVGVGLLGVSGWLGGELVYVRRVGVAPERAADAPDRGRRAA